VEKLSAQKCCLTAQEIFDQLREDGRAVGIASVYRVLEVLAELGLVQRVDVGDGAARFEPAYPSGEHHHHLLCSNCGDVVAFEDAALERVILKLGERLDAVIEGHDVVLHGVCAACNP
jgi:Fur family ferric uptake transcriptional regulator